MSIKQILRRKFKGFKIILIFVPALVLANFIWLTYNKNILDNFSVDCCKMDFTEVYKLKCKKTNCTEFEDKRMHLQISQEPKSTDESQCNKLMSIGHDTISTSDLHNETNYSLSTDGKYIIPSEMVQSEDSSPTAVINVTLIPFSHADPGYGMTVEQYYDTMTRSVLNNMVEKLTQYQNMTFQWAEVVFLERWFRDITDDKKKQVQQLIQRGQLEIVLGGWVMPDEAVTHYVPVIDQLIEGHQWLLENLGVKPVNAWINDPFGYSSTMPYLWKNSGIQNMVILRIHQAIKATLMRKRSLEFMWRPFWNSDDVNDILCNIMPYENYWNADVCGPDQKVCQKFVFLHLPNSNAQPVSNENIDNLAKTLYETYKFTAKFYQFNNLVIFIGEDNSFTQLSSWDDTYTNYDKLFSYINARPGWHMNIKFGTLQQYFRNVRTVEKNANRNLVPNFNTLKGDFFPYSDRNNEYWTGYFSTRMWIKRFTRELEPVLRAADIFSVIAYNFCIASGKCANISETYKNILSNLRSARRDMGIFQHHDGITGTSVPHVVQDYENRLSGAFTNAQHALAQSVITVLSHGKVTDSSAVRNSNEKLNAREILTLTPLKLSQNGITLFIINPLEKAREDVVSILLDKGSINISENIQCQVSKATVEKYQNNFEVTFPIKMSSFEIKKIHITEMAGNVNLAEKKQEVSSEKIIIENKYLKVEFNGKNGSLERIIDQNGRVSEIKTEYLKYNSQGSGAYIFGPGGPAERLEELNTDPEIYVTKGNVVSSVRVVHKAGFTQTFKLKNVSGVQGQGIFVSNEITLEQKQQFMNIEVILRLKTDINNGNTFYTDQNGFQLVGRKTYTNEPIQTNFYPMSTMAVLEDDVKRLTLSSAQSHGVASLKNGWLEVMLDRNMQTDDRRGLGQGAMERVLTLTELFIQVEHKIEINKAEEVRYTYASLNSIQLNEQFQSRLQTFSIEKQEADFESSFNLFNPIKNFPCDLTIVVLRNLVTNDLNVKGTSLVLHRKSSHCSFPVLDLQCGQTSEPFTLADFRFGLDTSSSSVKVSVEETSLTHLHIKRSRSVRDDLRPSPNEIQSFLIKV